MEYNYVVNNSFSCDGADVLTFLMHLQTNNASF